jgi:exosortase/archaeosortase family protein
MKNFLAEVNKFIKKYNLNALRGVIIFAIITIVIHYSYRFWAMDLDYKPIHNQVMAAHDALSEIVYRQSSWFDAHVLKIPIITDDENRVIHFEGNGFIGISEGCSGLKQILQVFLLFLIYPGPWKHKAWFIPMGIILVHLTNLFRITGLSVVVVNWPAYWQFSHDYMFRPFFYVVIFFLWVWWVEKFSKF